DAQPLALNFFSAVCAALTLMLLARSVALLPQDRTREQRARLRSADGLLDGALAWLPPVLAVFVLGLQRTFWEHATAATGEMLNLLLFAAVIRCLLEFRASQKDSWLVKAGLFYALGTADNYALVGFFPLAVAVFAMLKGRALFEPRFLLCLLACAVVGIALYLVPPWLVTRDMDAGGTFLEWLRIELGTQKNSLIGFPRSRALILALLLVVPAVLMSIRWPSSFGDTSAVGTALTNFLFRLVHSAFLVVGVWIAFDPAFGPRALGFGVPFLTFSFLGALAVGYFAGYFLLLSRGGEEKSWRQEPLLLRAINQLFSAAVCVAAISVPLMLVKRNLPSVRAQNGPALRRFAELSRDSLLEKPALIGAHPFFLYLQAGVADPLKPAPLLLDARWLPLVSYHRKLARHYPGRWPTVPAELAGTNTFLPAGIAQGLTSLAATNPIVYLHPAYGVPLLENHYAVPRGLVCELRRYTAGALVPPAPSAADIGANQAVWAAAVAQFPALREAAATGSPDAPVIASFYSAALNYWGVELQRNNLLPDAQRAFTTAWQLNTNPVARVNLDVNQLLREGKAVGTNLTARADEVLRENRTWAALLGAHGPLDEPEHALQLGQALLSDGLPRQALQQFFRALALNPANLAPRVVIAETLLQARRTDDAAAQLQAIRAAPDFSAAQTAAREAIVLRLEALVQMQRTNNAAAEQLLLRARDSQPRDLLVLDTLSQFYLLNGRLTNAASVLRAELEVAPDNPRALVNLAAIHNQQRDFAAALPLLDRALKLQANNINALINRGYARLSLGKLDDAESDYRDVVKFAPTLHAGYFGLAEAAFLRKQPAEARKYFEQGLRLAPPDSPEAKKAAERLKELQSGAK
ncbi:MAG: tetratricopeptide repeat protein, partial [Verrucomicrobia bacterium]|nr:tetratricopeptide repeat protein [Verrucomicrobiota bacterium]